MIMSRGENSHRYVIEGGYPIAGQVATGNKAVALSTTTLPDAFFLLFDQSTAAESFRRCSRIFL
jgi:hypothetical protein